ncbi:MAG: helix-turn-helix transcriptional regulator [Actinobacteria bacterium]|nr:helix-turn-helix transcriptional regulator [Actinomycetota bacterium]
MSECEGGARNADLDWALTVLGDRWTLLVLYEISSGTVRFNDIQRYTGIPRNRLASRLRCLEGSALICRRRYCEHPPRFEYGLTDAGRSLAATLEALQVWAVRYSPSARARRVGGSPTVS